MQRRVSDCLRYLAGGGAVQLGVVCVGIVELYILYEWRHGVLAEDNSSHRRHPIVACALHVEADAVAPRRTAPDS